MYLVCKEESRKSLREERTPRKSRLLTKKRRPGSKNKSLYPEEMKREL